MGKIGYTEFAIFDRVVIFNWETRPIHSKTRLIRPIFTDSLKGIVSGIRLDTVSFESETTRPSRTRLDRVLEPCLSMWRNEGLDRLSTIGIYYAVPNGLE